MNYDPAKHHRRSIRLKDYDYTQAGAYFITLCVENRACVLGDVIDGEMQLSPSGAIVADAWEWLAQQYPYVAIDEYVVMPNHFHGIIVIDAPTVVGAVREPPNEPPTSPPTMGAVRVPPNEPPTVGAVRVPPNEPPRKPLGRLIGAFKTVSTKRINELNTTPGISFWQRNYYEHIIRHENALDRIRGYIIRNPMKWAIDRQNPLSRR
jgi:REP element-mobilizing transposase RayT